AAVGSITFGNEISETVSAAAALLGESEATRILQECYRPGETFGTAFAKLFTRSFAEYGVIMLDGSDPELDRIAAPLYRAAIERAPELNHVLLERDKQLQAAGYHQQARITNSSTLLFIFRDGSRVPVHADSNGEFLIGEEHALQDEMLGLVNSAPESFSPNVLLRPVAQDYLLPTLAYVGGAAEVAYFAQVGVVHQHLLNRVTPILPRFSASLLEPKVQALLERY